MAESSGLHFFNQFWLLMEGQQGGAINLKEVIRRSKVYGRKNVYAMQDEIMKRSDE